MKSLITAILAVLGVSALALAQNPRIKSWKTLTNDNGFEFKYPDCWTLRPDNPDEMEMPVTAAHFVVAEETKACARPLLNPPHNNLIGFTAGIRATTKEESLKIIKRWEKAAKNAIERKDWSFFKRLKFGPDDAIVVVEFHNDIKYNWIAWRTEIFCPTVKISFGGPAIKDPDPSYFEKFKAGEMAMPEPEKTIFNSIRCIEPKRK
ncbi:MAG: hypothetical protein A2428_00355 [Bdellovibrionales bacterium RIFOXYC1_FULL_54_43]|nr:MAG: hypothetical protein A2428_00355 [Bdellovibrionales bacterium RIFOXYC1_FULL_54_43]OFZ81907.1 MAG: hypothetical protein A2603_03045 [Bdellovibrionales bacterium RIFOXYD1_FULL_55_31]